MKRILMFTAALAVAVCSRAAIQPIDGANAVGFAAITAPGIGSTIITVPFEACLGSGAAGMLSDLVATNGLTSAGDPAAADQLVVLTTSGPSQVYYYYWYQTGIGWTKITTEKIMPDGSLQTLTPPEANAFAIARGLGFWIKRSAVSATPVYVKGQISSAHQTTAINPGLNLVGYASLSDFTLNDSGIDWTGAYGGTGNTKTSDKILVVNTDGTFTEYFYFVKPDGWAAGYSALDHKWITSGYTLANVTIPAGQGFWYLRRGTGSFPFHLDGQRVSE